METGEYLEFLEKKGILGILPPEFGIEKENIQEKIENLKEIAKDDETGRINRLIEDLVKGQELQINLDEVYQNKINEFIQERKEEPSLDHKKILRMLSREEISKELLKKHKIGNELLTKVELMEIISTEEAERLKNYISFNPIMMDTIDNFDIWLNVQLPLQISEREFIVVMSNQEYLIKIELNDIKIPEFNGKRLTPYLAIKYSKTYYAKCECIMKIYRIEKTKTDILYIEENDKQYIFNLFDIPIITGSMICSLAPYVNPKHPEYNLLTKDQRKEELIKLNEDPRMPYGYPIFKGRIRRIVNGEGLRKERISVKIDKGGNPYIKYWSFTNTDSRLLQLHYNENYEIMVEIDRFEKRIENINKYNHLNILVIIDFIDIFYLNGKLNRRSEEIRIKKDLKKQGIIYAFREIISKYIKGKKWLNYFIETENAYITSYTSEVEYSSYYKNNKKAKEAFSVLKKIHKNNFDLLVETFLKIENLSDKEIKNTLDDIFIYSIFPEKRNTKNSIEIVMDNKIELFALLISRFLEVKMGIKDSDNTNQWKTKKIRDAAGIFSSKFRSGMINLITNIIKISDNGTLTFSTLLSTIEDSKDIKTSITNIFKQNASEDALDDTEDLKLFNMPHVYNKSREIKIKINSLDKDKEKKTIQIDSLGYICVVTTPTSGYCGSTKTIAITAKVTPNTDFAEEIENLIEQGLVNYERTDEYKDYLLYKHYIYWCNSDILYTILRNNRDIGLYNKIIPAIIKEYNYIEIYTESGRLIRPLLSVNPNTNMIRLYELDYEERKNKDFNNLINEGYMQYIDVAEFSILNVADSVQTLKSNLIEIEEIEFHIESLYKKLEYLENDLIYELIGDEEMLLEKENIEKKINNLEYILHQKKIPYDYCEIHPSAILGPSASIIIEANKASAPRMNITSKENTQAISNTSFIPLNPSSGGYLHYPQPPLVGTSQDENMGIDKYPLGKNLLIAFMADPYTIEDSFVIRRGTMEKDLSFTRIISKKIEIDSKKIIKKPTNIDEGLLYKYRFIGENGLPYIGAEVEEDDVILGIVEEELGPTNKFIQKPSSEYMKKGERGKIKNVSVIEKTGSTKIVTIIIEDSKYLIIGNKLYARNMAQKGTIGEIRDDINMFFVEETGQIIDIIVNVNAIPSRMTIGYLLELLFGIFVDISGKRIDSLMYEDIDYIAIKRILMQFGYSTSGSTVINPRTSTKFQSQIYVGPGLIGILNKYPEETYYSRGIGSVNKETLQPSRGRTEKGASMFSWMEVGAIISAGAPYLLMEQNCTKSDPVEVPVCLNCNRISSIMYKGGENPYMECRHCGNFYDISDYTQDDEGHGARVVIPYSTRLLQAILSVHGIYLGITVVDEVKYVERIKEKIESGYLRKEAILESL